MKYKLDADKNEKYIAGMTAITLLMFSTGCFTNDAVISLAKVLKVSHKDVGKAKVYSKDMKKAVTFVLLSKFISDIEEL